MRSHTKVKKARNLEEICAKKYGGNRIVGRG